MSSRIIFIQHDIDERWWGHKHIYTHDYNAKSMYIYSYIHIYIYLSYPYTYTYMYVYKKSGRDFDVICAFNFFFFSSFFSSVYYFVSYIYTKRSLTFCSLSSSLSRSFVSWRMEMSLLCACVFVWFVSDCWRKFVSSTVAHWTRAPLLRELQSMGVFLFFDS